MKFFFFLLMISCTSSLFGQLSDSIIQFHFQQTVVTQGHPTFSAKYTGPHSLQPKSEYQTSLTTTLFMGVKLWKGGSFYFNPELAGGSGVSKTLGVGGFFNGETFRVGNVAPTIYLARGFIRQHIFLNKNNSTAEEDLNQVHEKLTDKRITITAGKFGLTDIFDNNAYSHDPRTQFLNWSLMSNGAWDYPANTRGYTVGIAGEYYSGKNVLRACISLEPKEANGPELDKKISKAFGTVLEFEKKYSIREKNGIIHILGFYNQARMGNYRQAVLDTSYHTDIALTRKYGRMKAGFGFSLEQSISKSTGLFFRTSWNDGKNETWAFTEIDHSISAGTVIHGNAWRREQDHCGIAIVLNGISRDHRDYLAAGGLGFMLGDGRLNYRKEFITELYYSFQIQKYISATPDIQFAINPGYNKDRGPVLVFGGRLHTEF